MSEKKKYFKTNNIYNLKYNIQRNNIYIRRFSEGDLGDRNLFEETTSRNPN